MAIRIWHQSLLDLAQLPEYAALLAEHGSAVRQPQTVIDIHGVETGPWPEYDYPRFSGHGYHLKLVQIVENGLRAQREGYDAMALSVFLDPGLEQLREALDIPVVSALETALNIAAKVGRSIGLITRSAAMNPRVRYLVRRYGFAARVQTIQSLAFPMGLDELERITASPERFVAAFALQGAELVRAGVDVIIPAEGLLNTALIRCGLREVEGVPVLDSYAALIAEAETLVKLRRSGVARPARNQVPRDVAEQLRGATAALLVRDGRGGAL